MPSSSRPGRGADADASTREPLVGGSASSSSNQAPGPAGNANASAGSTSPRRGGQQSQPTAESASAFRFAADGGANYLTVATEDAQDGGSRDGASIDFEELEHDPSERRPGGPIVEMIREKGPRVWFWKWIGPGVTFLIALLVQAAGLHIATHTYVLRMSEMERIKLGSDAGVSLAHEFRIRDRFQLSFAGEEDAVEEGAPVLRLPQTIDGDTNLFRVLVSIISIALTVFWALSVLRSSNLRLWTRTLVVASIMALLKGFLSFATVLPDPAGWENCRMKLMPWALNHFKQDSPGAFFFVESFAQIIMLWVQDILTGMRFQEDLVCTKTISGPGYLTAISALGLFEAARIDFRRKKPHFRALYHLLTASFLTFIVLLDSYLAIKHSEQYTVDVILALSLCLLLFSSPVIAVFTDRWMTFGCLPLTDLKEEVDTGDMVIPPCCVPFCWVHGRYFLFTVPASKALEARRQEELERQEQEKDARIAEEFRVEQETATLRAVEIEAQIKAIHEKAAKHSREKDAETQIRIEQALADLRKKHEQRVAKDVEGVNQRWEAEKSTAEQWEANALAEKQRLELTIQQIQEERERLQKEYEKAQEALEKASTTTTVSGGDFRCASADAWQAIYAPFAKPSPAVTEPAPQKEPMKRFLTVVDEDATGLPTGDSANFGLADEQLEAARDRYSDGQTPSARQDSDTATPTAQPCIYRTMTDSASIPKEDVDSTGDGVVGEAVAPIAEPAAAVEATPAAAQEVPQEDPNRGDVSGCAGGPVAAEEATPAAAQEASEIQQAIDKMARAVQTFKRYRANLDTSDQADPVLQPRKTWEDAFGAAKEVVLSLAKESFPLAEWQAPSLTTIQHFFDCSSGVAITKSTCLEELSRTDKVVDEDLFLVACIVNLCRAGQAQDASAVKLNENIFDIHMTQLLSSGEEGKVDELDPDVSEELLASLKLKAKGHLQGTPVEGSGSCSVM